MNANDFVQLVLLAVDGEIKGKTKLQKIVYFLGVKTGCVDDLGYRAHFYGPFSSEVAHAAERLCVLGLADKNVQSIGGVNRQGFEISRHDYRLTERGRCLAKKKADKNPELWEEMEQASRELSRCGDRGYMELTIAAKTFYLLGEKKGSATIAELSELAGRLGWSVSHDQIDKASEFLRCMQLVSYGGS